MAVFLRRVALVSGLAFVSTGALIAACTTFGQGDGAQTTGDAATDASVGGPQSDGRTADDASNPLGNPRTDAGTSADSGVEYDASAYAAAVMADNPIAYWRFEDVTTGTAIDENAMAHNLEAMGTPTHAVGAVGQAVHLNGFTDGYSVSTLTNDPLLGAGASPLTVEAWIQRDASGSTLGPVANFFAANASPDGWSLESNNYLTFERADGTGPSATATSNSAVLNTPLIWYHVAAVYDSTANTNLLFVNGVPASQVLSDPTVINATGGPTKFFIGAELTGSLHFTGLIDEVAIYGTALSQARLQAHINAR